MGICKYEGLFLLLILITNRARRRKPKSLTLIFLLARVGINTLKKIIL